MIPCLAALLPVATLVQMTGESGMSDSVSRSPPDASRRERREVRQVPRHGELVDDLPVQAVDAYDDGAGLGVAPLAVAARSEEERAQERPN